MTAFVDTVVIGGGPAGLAAAAACRQTGRTVALLERGPRTRPRVGETLGAEAGAALRALGAGALVDAHLSAAQPFTEVRSTWGGPEPAVRSMMLHPLGAGWHVDRARFDAALAAWVVGLGVTIEEGLGPVRLHRAGDGITARAANGRVLHAAEAIDATGRGAPASTRLADRRWVRIDHEVALLARFTPGPAAAAAEPGLLLEAMPEGYWYSAPVLDDTLIVVFVTDADLLPAPRNAQAFATRLARTSLTRARLGGHRLCDAPQPFRADSGWCPTPRAPGWQAIGDAALATDPLGGNGIARALQAALEAPAPPAPAEATTRAAQAIGAYLDLRERYYLLETRWPDALFWARRRPTDRQGQPVDWRTAPLWLAPDRPLHWTEGPAPPAAEAFAPRAALRALRAALVTPTPAHRALTTLRTHAPLGDRRLLVAVQRLIEMGLISAG